jgi:hypothetical protein
MSVFYAYETEVERPKPIDRGYARCAIQTYARLQGITYEDAMQIRENGRDMPNVTSVAPGPDKWERSRKDEEHRQARARLCREHLHRIKREFGI